MHNDRNGILDYAGRCCTLQYWIARGRLASGRCGENAVSGVAQTKRQDMKQQIGAGLLSCADKIWETADTLRGAGIKASEWPAYMMPFFALMMLESRLRRFRQGRLDEFRLQTATAFNFEDDEETPYA